MSYLKGILGEIIISGSGIVKRVKSVPNQVTQSHRGMWGVGMENGKFEKLRSRKSWEREKEKNRNFNSEKEHVDKRISSRCDEAKQQNFKITLFI